MINYQYQILRYLPDRVGGEFVNLGVVVFNRDTYCLKAKFLDRIARVATFFPKTDARYLHSTLYFLQMEFKTLAHQWKRQLPLDKFDSVDAVTRTILPKDDSALIFSDAKFGRELDETLACNYLFERVVKRNLSEADEIELKNDRDVWHRVYKEYFDKHEVVDKLRSFTLHTENDTLDFDRAWKNGKWNCFETVSFDLVKEDSIKNKVYRWAGKIDELATAKEPVNLYLLAIMPKNERLRKFINKKLNGVVDNTDSTVTIITKSEVERLVRTVKDQMEAHN